MSDLRLFEVAGAPRAMGECFGEELRESTRELSQSRMDHLMEFVQKHEARGRLTRKRLLEMVEATVPVHRRFDPEIWEEFCGIARGANIGVPELLIGNGYTDFCDYVLCETREAVARSFQAPSAECTAFLVPDEWSDGPPIVGQTWDMNADARDFVVLVRRRPDDAPETLGVTTAGCLCLIGMNSQGVATGNNNLVPTDAQIGVNYLFTITRVLKCSSAREGADVVEATPRLSGHNYYVADGRTTVNIETTARSSQRTAVEREVFVHANHYLDEGLRPLEFAGIGRADTEWRQRRLSEGFRALEAPITMDVCWQQLADDTRGDGCICNEDYEGDYGGSATLATVVMCPGKGMMFACKGGAKSGARRELTF